MFDASIGQNPPWLGWNQSFVNSFDEFLVLRRIRNLAAFVRFGNMEVGIPEKRCFASKDMWMGTILNIGRNIDAVLFLAHLVTRQEFDRFVFDRIQPKIGASIASSLEKFFS